LGRVRFTREANPAVDKGQSVGDKAQAFRDWSELESHLCELANLSSELSSKLAIEPRDPLGLLLNRNRPMLSGPRASIKPTTRFNSPNSIAQAESASEPHLRPFERKPNSFDVLSNLASIFSKQSYQSRQ
jgi:hypothetical protein